MYIRFPNDIWYSLMIIIKEAYHRNICYSELSYFIFDLRTEGHFTILIVQAIFFYYFIKNIVKFVSYILWTMPRTYVFMYTYVRNVSDNNNKIMMCKDWSQKYHKTFHTWKGFQNHSSICSNFAWLLTLELQRLYMTKKY